MAGKKKERGALMPVRVDSLEDIARLAYNFNFTSENVFASDTGEGITLYALGEKLDGVVLAYSIPAAYSGGFLLYRPPENSEEEKARMSHHLEDGWQAINVLGMHIEELGLSKNAGRIKFKHVEMGSLEDLVKLAIKGSSDDDNTLSRLYCFSEGAGSIVYGLDLIGSLHDGDCIVYYAKVKTQNRNGFAMYDYKTGRVAFTGSVGEHSYMYLKIINLAEKPAFFR